MLSAETEVKNGIVAAMPASRCNVICPGLPDHCIFGAKSSLVTSVVKYTKKTKGKYKEKQRALLKVWLQKCSNLATLNTSDRQL